jgi:hypothetical protein
MELMSARQTWTDDRMDDLCKRVDDGFAQVHGDIKDVRRELGSTREELRAEIGLVREELRGEIGSLREEIGSTRNELHGALSKEVGSVQRRLDSEAGSLRGEMVALRAEFNQGFVALNHRLDTLQVTLVAALLTGIISLIASQLT